MAYSLNDTWIEACKFIDQALREGQSMSPDWITMSIMARHSLPGDFKGEHAEFFEIHTQTDVRQIVRKAVGRFKASSKLDSADPQLILPGWEHLQRGYLVSRDDEQLLVPIDQLDDRELERKALEYEHMGRSCFAHAREIRRYVQERRRAA